jgi:mono/diheme cytochrome c family protein
MKRFLKILGVLVLVLFLAGAGGFVYIKKALPNGGPMVKVNIPKDSATIKRGEYLARHITGCVDCHTPRNVSLFGIPAYPDSLGKGGLAFNHDLGFPGNVISRNITPAGIGSWSDDQFYHTITTGVDSKGEPLFPVMPYPHYGIADPEDMTAIVAYIRTLKPIENKVAERELDFPVSLFVRMAPAAATPGKRPAESDTLAYGKYLFNMASCTDCHTPMDKGKPIEELTMAGGFTFHLKGMGTVRSANITPDKETGIGNWSQQEFIARIKAYENPANRNMPWQKVGYQTVMPWLEYSGMKEQDLAAIYKYLRTLKPINHKVVKWTPEGGGEKTALR